MPPVRGLACARARGPLRVRGCVGVRVRVRPPACVGVCACVRVHALACVCVCVRALACVTRDACMGVACGARCPLRLISRQFARFRPSVRFRRISAHFELLRGCVPLEIGVFAGVGVIRLH